MKTYLMKSLAALMLMFMAATKVTAQEAYAFYKNGTLTFYYDTNKDNRTGGDIYAIPESSVPGWYTDHRTDITKVVFSSTFSRVRPKSTAYWFAVANSNGEQSALQQISGIQYLNTSEVTNMSYMFFGCRSLTSLDVSGFDTGNVTAMDGMFHGCSGLMSLDVSGFDTGNVTSMAIMFNGCSGLTSLDVSGWNTGNVTTMDLMFAHCSGLTSLDVSGWNTGNVMRMYTMFRDCRGLTSLDVSGWNTSNVMDMCYMFYGCRGLTSLDVSGWNTGNVLFMWYMFYGCSGLTSLNLSGWDTGNVTFMNNMFEGCSGLTSLDVSGWNTGNVTEMDYMFYGCSSLTSLDVSGWNTSNVTYMDYMFNNCSGLSAIYCGSNWKTDNVSNSSEMFTGCTQLMGGNGTAYDPNHTDAEYARLDGGPDAPGYLTDREPYAVYNNGTLSFYYDKSREARTGDKYRINSGDHNMKVVSIENAENPWDTQFFIRLPEGKELSAGDNVRFSMWVRASHDAHISTQAHAGPGEYLSFGVFGEYDVSTYWVNVGGDFTIPENNDSENTAKVGTIAFDLNNNLEESIEFYFDRFSIKKLGENGNEGEELVVNGQLEGHDMSAFFMRDAEGEHETFGGNIVINGYEQPEFPGWHCDYRSKIKKVAFNSSFAKARPKSTQNWFALENLKTMSNIKYLNTSNVTNMNGMFNGCRSLTSLDVSGFNTSNVTEMGEMFKGCSGLTSLDVSGFDTSSVTGMGFMFMGCSGLTSLDVSNFDVSNVFWMSFMFSGCSGLTSLDVSNWNTSNVIHMWWLFSGCSGLTSLDVSGFNTSNVTLMSNMFAGCNSLTNLDVSNFDTGNVTDMSWMFDGCNSLTSLDVSSFETGNVTSMEEMFSDLFSIKTLDLRNFDTRNVTNMNSMFAGSGMSTIYSGDHWNMEKLENSESMFWACENLMGGQGTTFNWNHTDGEYARPDGGPSAPGYFTDREPYAVYNNGILTFYYDRNKETRQGEKYRINGGDREIKVVSIENAENPWDTQFFIRLPEGKELSAGDNIRFSMDVKASQDAHISTEAHKEPEEYLHWWMVGDYDVSTNWTHVGGDFTVTDELSETDKVGTVTFTLNNNQEESIEFYFDNISLKKIDENGNEEELVVNGQMEGNNWSSYVVKDADGTHDVTDNNLVINIYNQPDYPGWFCDHRTDITKAVFKSSFVDVRPVKTTNWFAVGNKNTEESALREIVGMQYLNTSEVVSMKNMFYGSRSLTNLDVSGFITSNVTDMYNMFDACSSLTNLDLSNFDTGNVTNMEWMFVDCSSLTNLDLSGFDTGNVTNMSGMFLGCSSLTSLDVSGFNTGNVTNMEWMFGWTSLTNLDVSGFDTRNVTSMAWMFIGCENLATIYCGEDWSTESVVFSEAMFDNCLSLVGGMGTTFDWAHTDAEYARADGGPSAPGYFTLEGAVPTNLNSTLADEDGEVARYGVDGTPLTGKRRGVNIVRMKDGTIRKVVVK